MSTVEPPPADVDIVDTAAAGPAAIRGGILRTASFVLGLLIGLASAPLVVRHLGDVEFGRYTSALVVVAIVAGLTDAGVSTIALRELSATRDPAARDRLMGELLGLRLVLSIAGVGLAVAFAAVAGYAAGLVLGILLAGVGMVLGLLQSLYATVLHSRLRFGWAALIDLARSVVGVGLIVVVVLTGGGVVELLATSIPAALVTLAITLWLVRDMVALRPAFAVRRWLPLVRETLVFAVAVAVNTLYFRVTLVAMTLVATGLQTGYFAISYRIMEVLVGIPLLLIGAAFPIISRSARGDRERFEYATGRIFELAVFLGGLMALGLLLSAPFAIEVLTGRADHPSVPVLQIQSAAIAASFVAAGVGYALLSMRRHREVLIANCVPLVLAVALVLVLAPEIGARGAAVAAVVADVALAVASTALLM
ncbi:MAG: oligosaccharide flippase family protein, partial [Solirubrobacteraceae bacterium]